jgi:hypothetical protein
VELILRPRPRPLHHFTPAARGHGSCLILRPLPAAAASLRPRPRPLPRYARSCGRCIILRPRPRPLPHFTPAAAAAA